MNFNHSESIKAILPALVKVQQEMPQLAKDKKNPHANSEYLTLDNILGSLLPILNKHGIFLTQIPVETREEEAQSIGVDTLLLHESGEYVLYPAVYYAFEKGGRMNMTQSVGSIITYSKRYALTSIFGISTNEDADGVQQANIQPRKSKRERKWQEFTKNRDELFERVTELATESMQSTGSVNKEMLKRVGKELGEEQAEITPENLSEYNKQLRLAEINFKKSKSEKESTQQEEQGSLLEGGTTQPNIEWGN